MEIGARAKMLVTDSDVKQKKLAESIGISEAKLSHYLNGRYEMPTHVVISIAKYFHVSTDYLLGLTDIPEVQKPISKTERQLIEDLRTLSWAQKELIVKNILIMQEQNQRDPHHSPF